MTEINCTTRRLKNRKKKQTINAVDNNISNERPIITPPPPHNIEIPIAYQIANIKTRAVINMARIAFDKMISSICSRPVETGGLMLGPIESNDVTDFYFDATASVTKTSYSPDCATLSHKLKTEWIPSGIDFKGFAHSHPGILDRLTLEDMAYIQRLLVINPDMELFIAPIIIPSEFRVRMIIVFRDNPSVAVDAHINFI